MDLRRVALMVCLMMPAFSSFGVSQVRIAVIPFSEESAAIGSALGPKVARMINLRLTGVGTLAVVEQGLVERALEDIALEPQTSRDLAWARELAIRLGASHLVLGTVAGGEEELLLAAQIMEVEGPTILAGDTVRGPQGEVLSLSDRLFSLLSLSFRRSGIPFGEVPFVHFEETYSLTPMDMENRQDSHGFAVLHRDPDLGWELGVACRSSPSNTVLGRYCSSVIFRVSQDLSKRLPNRGVDGLVTVSYTQSTLGSLSEVWPEVRLEGLDRILTFEVEPLNAIIAKDFVNANRLDPQVFGARQIEVRVRLSG